MPARMLDQNFWLHKQDFSTPDSQFNVWVGKRDKFFMGSIGGPKLARQSFTSSISFPGDGMWTPAFSVVVCEYFDPGDSGALDHPYNYYPCNGPSFSINSRPDFGAVAREHINP